MSLNPYQTPTADVSNIADVVPGDAEAIRKEHINHEASVRSIGLLYYLAFIGFTAAAVLPLLQMDVPDMADTFGMLAFFLVLGGIYLWVGNGLRRLNPSVRIVAGILSILGLLSFPVGTLINGYILYLLFSQKGKMVFSSEYRDIIDATPHIKYKTSIVVWILLGLVLVGLVAAVVIPMLEQ